MKNGRLTMEQLLALDDGHKQEIDVPEWGGARFDVWSMTGLERAKLEQRWAQKSATSDPAGFRADLLEHSVKSPDGSPYGTQEQWRKMLGKNARALERLVEAALEVSGFSAKDVSELEKNSPDSRR